MPSMSENGHPPSKERIAGQPRNVFVLGLVSLFNDIGSEMIFSIYPLFLTAVVGAGAEAIGLIEGIAESLSALLKTVSGWISDRTRTRKPLVIAGYSMANIAQPLMGLVSAWQQVLPLRIIDRIGKGVRTAPRDAIVCDSTPPEEYGSAFGFQRSMDSVGGVIGPILAFAVLAFFHWRANPGAPLLSYFVADKTTPIIAFRYVFYLAAIPNVICVLLMLLVREKARRACKDGAPKLTLAGFDRPFRLYLAATVCLGLSQFSNTFLILRAQAGGVAVPLIPLLYLFYHLVYSASAAPAGRASDTLGRKRVITMGYAVFILMSLGWIYVNTPVAAAGLFAMYGLFFGFTQGTERAFVADLTPAERRGTAMGLYHTAMGLALLPASAIAGVLWASFGPAAMFLFAGAMASVGLMLLSFVQESPFGEPEGES